MNKRFLLSVLAVCFAVAMALPSSAAIFGRNNNCSTSRECSIVDYNTCKCSDGCMWAGHKDKNGYCVGQCVPDSRPTQAQSQTLKFSK